MMEPEIVWLLFLQEKKIKNQDIGIKIDVMSHQQGEEKLPRTIPGRRCRRKRCFERLDPAGQTRCAGH